MAATAAANTVTAWILLLMGLYSVSAAIGELRKPGTWARMVWEIERSGALQFLTGLLMLVLGGAVYLVNPYNPADWTSILVTIIGGLMMLEGTAFLAFPDWMIRLARMCIGSGGRLYALASLVIGLALLFISYVSFLSA